MSLKRACVFGAKTGQFTANGPKLELKRGALLAHVNAFKLNFAPV